MKKIKKRGFTLVEILVIIAVIAILAVIVVPNMLKVLYETKKNAFVVDARKVLSIAENENLASEGIIELSKRYCSGYTGASKSLEFLSKEGIYYDVLIYANRIISYRASNDSYSIDISVLEGNYITSEDISASNVKNKEEENYQMVTCDGSIIGEPGEEVYELVFNPPVLGAIAGEEINFFSGVYGYVNGEVVLSETNDESITVNKTVSDLIEGDNEVIYTFHGKDYIRHVFLSSSQIAIEYTGVEEEVVITQSGTYTIEAYGAQGDGPIVVSSIFPKLDKETLIATAGGAGGKGGYVKGEKYLVAGTVLKVNIGGQNGYNGGGTGTYNGGGATIVKLGTDTLLIAAGGGGGASGTAGGSGNSLGGNGSVGLGYNQTAISPYSSVSGANGTNGGGGGSGNIYKDCTGYEQIYDACATGSNTCVGGYHDCNCNSCYYGSDLCPIVCTDWCWFPDRQEWNACNCHEECDPCRYGCDRCYNACATGSNTCVAGYKNGICNVFSEEKYNFGQGGNNTINTSLLSNTTSQPGLKEGNGKVVLILIGI